MFQLIFEVATKWLNGVTKMDRIMGLRFVVGSVNVKRGIEEGMNE